MLILLISYILFLVGFVIYSFSGIYHLWRFGYVGDLTKPAIFIYIFISASVITLSFIAISLRSWPSGF
jgi:hypothetical protein